MAQTGHGHDEHHDAAAHERHYWKVWVYLVILLVVSVAGPLAGDAFWADHAALGRLILVLSTAFGIAVVKAYLVIKNFMHLNIEPKYVAYISGTALAFMGLLFFFVAPDVMKHEGNNWTNLAAQAAVQRGMGGGETGAVPEEFTAAGTFQNTCSPCHGPDGQGNGPAAAALTPRPANFNDAGFWETRDRAHVIRVITEGGAAVGRSPVMAAFGHAFTAEQIEALADHVLGFRPEVEAPQAIPDAGAQVVPDAGAEAMAPDAGAEAVEPDAGAEAVEQGPEPVAGPTEAEVRHRADFIRRRTLGRLVGR